MAFDYRMREGSRTLRDKPRVFLLGRREELPLALSRIPDLVLGVSNCVIYFERAEEPSGEQEMEDILPRMQILIAAVTRAFLNQEAAYISRAMRIARAHHIPVLPLLLEEVDEEAYARLFDKDHRLMLYGGYDETAKSLQDKLSSFFEAVLPGDDMRRRVRESFCGYAFFSYRKVDRRYVKPLISTLYRQKAMRRIAVWYDEQLLPGRSFENEILDTLDKSFLFVLQVTPSLLEEENYVRMVEFPEALKRDKLILPIEVSDVDGEELARLYEGMPPVYDVLDGEQVESFLEQAVRECAPGAFSPMTPEEEYLLGLAYLDGIDVIVDRDFALTCLTRAAERGYAPSAEKLCVMYREGIGVKRDAEKTRYYGALAERLLRNARDDGRRQAYLDRLLLNAQEHFRERRYDEALRAFETICREAEQLLRGSDPDGEFAALQLLAKGTLGMGDVYAKRSDFERAERYLKESVQIREEIRRQASGADARAEAAFDRMAGVGYFHLGRLYYQRGYFAEAEGELLKTYQIRARAEDMLNLTGQGEYEARRDLAVVLNELGNLYYEWRREQTDADLVREMTGRALAFYREALKRKRMLVSEEGAVEQRRDFARTLHHLAVFEREIGEKEEAYRHIAESAAIRKELAGSGSAVDMTYYLQALDEEVALAEELSAAGKEGSALSCRNLDLYLEAEKAWKDFISMEEAGGRIGLQDYFDHHRRHAECLVSLALLARTMPGGERSTLTYLLEAKEEYDALTAQLFPMEGVPDTMKAYAAAGAADIYEKLATLFDPRTPAAIREQIGFLETACLYYQQANRVLADDAIAESLQRAERRKLEKELLL